MSDFVKYYENNLVDNPYVMSGTSASSRVMFLQEYIQSYTKKGGKILDVGCGDMYLSKILPEYEWTGLDVNTITNDGKCIKHDIESFPYPVEGPYDTVICSEVLEHLYEPVLVTKEIRRLIKPNGAYILSTPNFDWIENFVAQFRPIIFDPKKSWTKEHIHQYTKEAHEQILNSAGFKSVDYIGADPHFGKFFQHARSVLMSYIMDETKKEQSPAQIDTDKLLGSMFPDFSHTIIIVARPV